VENLPLVTIVVPVYNGVKTIKMCLDALTGLDWPRDKLEIIVVDNRSTDKTCHLVKGYSDAVLLHQHEILTASGARNLGIEKAKGEIIAFTDADCKPTRQWLRELLKDADDQSIGCFIGEVKPLPPKNVIEKYFNDEFWHNKPSEEGLPKAKTANCAYRKTVFDQIGLFDPKLNTAEDSDLLHRFAALSSLEWKFYGNAVVEHKNKDALKEFIKQFLRAGAWQQILAKKWPGNYKSLKNPTISLVSIRTLFHLRSFLYRLLVYPLHSSGERFFNYEIQDKRYHLAYPLLMIIVEICSYISFKFPNKFR
jgi:glycosyltransferase involved in cell wall biosynthesis